MSDNITDKNAKKYFGSGFLICLSIFLLSLLVRLIYLYQSSSNPSFYIPLIDAANYDDIARRFAGGEGMDSGFFWQPFFYQIFLSIVYMLSGSSILAAKILQVIVGSFTAVLTYKLGEKIFDRRIGIISGVVMVFYGPALFFESELLAVGWAAFWMVVVLLLFLKLESKPASIWYYILTGICIGLAIITRPTFVPFLFFAVVWLALKFRKNLSILTIRIAAIAGGILIITVPVGVVCHHVMGDFRILPSSGGVNLYIGNNPDYCRTVTARPGDEWIDIVEMPAREGLTKDKHDAFFKQQVVDYAADEPFAFISGMVGKAVEFFSSREIPRNVDVYVAGKWSSLLRLLLWKAGGFGFPFGIILPLAIIGLIYRYRLIPGPVLLSLILYPLSIILVFVSGRYRMPMVPVFVTLASAGFVSLCQFLKGKDWKKVSAIALIILLSVLVSTMPGPFCQEEPNYEAEFYFYLGLMNETMQNGPAEKSIEFYNRCLEIAPDFYPSYVSLGAISFEQKKNDLAVKYFTKVLELKPDYHRAHNALGLAFLDMGELEKAAGYFQTALKLRPYDEGGHNNLGLAFSRQGKLREAVEEFESALRLRSDSHQTHSNLGATLVEMGKLNEALIHYQKALELKPDYAGAMASIADLLQRQDKNAEAVIYYQKLIALVPGNSQLHHSLAVVLTKMGELELAIEHYKKAIELVPDAPQLHHDFAVALLESGKIKRAIDHFKKALEIEPDNFKTRKNLAILLFQTGQFELAIQYFEYILNVDKNSPEMEKMLAIAYAKYGTAFKNQSKFAQAIVYWKKAIAINNNFIAVHNNLAWTLSVYKDASFYSLRDGVAHAQRACELTENKNAALLDTLSVAYASNRNFSKAIETAEKALKIARSNNRAQLGEEISGHLELFRSGKAFYMELPSGDVAE
ncbi:MAG: tetratricopeptide repeat protein [Planctomycetes bacterium]|nr:tetratricopeptide repeat protein [Planctomycetota bacterium]